MHLPEVVVEVSVLHELEDHHECVALSTHAVEGDDVVVLQARQQLRLALKVRPRDVTRLPLQRLHCHQRDLPLEEVRARAQVHPSKRPLPQHPDEEDGF